MNRSSVKRCKERSLEEALQLLRKISETNLLGLEENHLLLLVRLLISLQLQMVNISTACRKVDQVSVSVQWSLFKLKMHRIEASFSFSLQMLQHLAKVDHQLVFRETRLCLHSIEQTDQVQNSSFTGVCQNFT